MIYTDIKYIELIGSTLSRFSRKKENLYNFRSPYCGDSAKNQYKARGFFYRKKTDMYYKCHNCGIGKTVSTFLKDNNDSLFKQYKLEKLKSVNIKQTKIQPSISFEQPNFKPKLSLNKYLTLVDDLDNEHVAVRFLKERKIPFKKNLYYTDIFDKFVHDLVPDKYPNLSDNKGRIIIPFYSREKDLMMLQGRAITEVEHNKRYVTIKIWDDALKIYGLDQINYTKDIYVVEGPFDSMFLDNCIAMGGGDCDSLSNIIPKDKAIMVYDNEPRNYDTIRRMKKAIDVGYRMFIWPEIIKNKDINEIFLKGVHSGEILKMINKNTFVGFGALLALNRWKRI